MAVAVAVILTVAGFFYWKNYYAPPTEEAPTAEQSTDLGSEVYRKATNPVSDKLPETTAPTPNPLQNIYKNPFQ